MFSETLKHITKGLFIVLAVLGLAFAFQAPSYAACMPGCTNDAVCAQRPDTCPNYKAGDLAVLLVTTNPPQPNQTVTRDRVFVLKRVPALTKPEFTYNVPIGTTSSNGTFTNAIPLPSDSSIFGRYYDTYSVGGVKGNTISYTVDE